MKFIFELLGVMTLSAIGLFALWILFGVFSAWYLGTFTDW